MKTALIDLDIIVNRAAHFGLVETDYVPTPDALKLGVHYALDQIDEWTDLSGCDDCRLFRSCSRYDNYRRLLYPSYKEHRDRPQTEAGTAMADLRNDIWGELASMCPITRSARMEADDLIGIEAGPNTVMVSIDKDFQSIPGKLYNPDKGAWVDYTTPARAHTFRLHQWAMGDSVDNIPGIPGIGTKKTDKIFAQARDDEADPAALILQKYLDLGYTEEAALIQWFLISILIDRPEYDVHSGWSIYVPAPNFDIYERNAGCSYYPHASVDVEGNSQAVSYRLGPPLVEHQLTIPPTG
jgi:hypothetical protein